MIEKLNNIDWFSACGKDITMENVVKSENLSSMKKTIQQTCWENMILEKQGDFTAQLSVSFKKQYSEWNNLVSEFKKKYLPDLQKKWKLKLAEMELDEKYIMDDIRFNILGIVVIDAYRDCIPMPDFFKELLKLYESGHLPCGWKGKKDAGNFIVY